LELCSVSAIENLPEGSKITKILREKDISTIKKLPMRFTIDCNLLIAKNPKLLRLLTTDKCLVVPAKLPIRFLITSSDVIHS
jgi:heme/copper-type cytochrome/quinol oxidase subunit 2